MWSVKVPATEYFHSIVQGQSSAPISAFEGRAVVGSDEFHNKDRKHYKHKTPPSYHHDIISFPGSWRAFSESIAACAASSPVSAMLVPARAALGSVPEPALCPAGPGALIFRLFTWRQSVWPRCIQFMTLKSSTAFTTVSSPLLYVLMKVNDTVMLC